MKESLKRDPVIRLMRLAYFAGARLAEGGASATEQSFDKWITNLYKEGVA